MDNAHQVDTHTSRDCISTVVCDHKIQNASISFLIRNSRSCGSETLVLIEIMYHFIVIGDINSILDFLFSKHLHSQHIDKHVM